jgi:nicotinate-nucleotide adenylyltransferase
MVQLAVKNYPKMRASNIEFSLPKPSYTIDTLTYLKEKYPDYSFALIMGEDNLESLPKWKNSEKLIQTIKLLFIPELLKEKKRQRISKTSKYPSNKCARYRTFCH